MEQICIKSVCVVCACMHWVRAILSLEGNSRASIVPNFRLLLELLPFQARGLFLFSIFIFKTGSRFQPMTRVHPHSSLFLLSILPFYATCTPSVFKSLPAHTRTFTTNPRPPWTSPFIPSGRTLENRGIRKWRLCYRGLWEHLNVISL